MMARNNFSKLLDELDALPHPVTGEYSPIKRRVDKTSAAGKKVRAKQSNLAKSLSVRELMAKAGIDANLKPSTVKKPAKTGPVDRAEPREHTALRVARAIGEMKAHAAGKDLNGPVTERQLQACHALAHAGEMTRDEVADVEKALSDKRALPTYILRKLHNA